MKSKREDGLKVAQLVQSGDAAQAAILRAPGLWESRGIGNSYLITTDDGDVLVNAGTLGDAKRGKARFAAVSDHQVRYVILTQSHANQYGGLEVYETPKTLVAAHRLYPEDRVHAEVLSAHYRRGSRRIFGGITGRTEDMLPMREVPPDLLIGDEGETFQLGNRRFELIWTPGGETRSALIVWLPNERIAVVGNLFGPLFGNHPNLNTLRGDKPRSAIEFIRSAQAVRALNPELILTGHEVIEGGQHIRTELTRIIDSVQWVHDRTIDGMNAGEDVRSLMRTIVPPPHLTLTEDYGKVAWNVRAIWHEYSGWFDPSRGITELYGTPATVIASTIAELTGGVDPMIERASALMAQGQPLEALHLLDIVLAADPTSAQGLGAKRAALQALDMALVGNNLWERRWIAAALRDLEVGPAAED